MECDSAGHLSVANHNDFYRTKNINSIIQAKADFSNAYSTIFAREY